MLARHNSECLFQLRLAIYCVNHFVAGTHAYETIPPSSPFDWRPLPAGFERPSAIQQRAIRPIQKGRDVIAQAQSGTGKTATFSISVLQSLDTTLRETQVLILSPTRELAVQIQKVSGSSLLDGRGGERGWWVTL